MKKIFFLCLMLVAVVGCAPLRQYEVKDVECRVLGLDASIPIPFAKGVNIMNIRLGWVETRYLHGYKIKFNSDVKQEIKYLGTVNRKLKIE